eukprot:GHVP01039430.1.p2 GENE.GHVP01039430.1~~GHVP01039430.1.p2  ORF type:complete len:316 (+),score=43.95 GHVP01039430.1:2783-3730(+)
MNSEKSGNDGFYNNQWTQPSQSGYSAYSPPGAAKDSFSSLGNDPSSEIKILGLPQVDPFEDEEQPVMGDISGESSNFQNQKPGAESNTPPTTWFLIPTLTTLRTYFDVTTNDVLKKLLTAIFPIYQVKAFPLYSVFQNPQTSCFYKNPDFWGVFWVPTSLSILTFLFASVFPHFFRGKATPFTFLFSLEVILWVITAFTPLLAFLAAAILLGPPARTTILCRTMISLFGYSLFVYVPISPILMIPSKGVRIGLLIISFFFASVTVGFHTLITCGAIAKEKGRKGWAKLFVCFAILMGGHFAVISLLQYFTSMAFK